MGNPGIPPDEIEHGVNWRICKADDGKKCHVCKAAHAVYMREYRAGKRRREPWSHGTRTGYAHCRQRPEGACDDCKKAQGGYMDAYWTGVLEMVRLGMVHGSPGGSQVCALGDQGPCETCALTLEYGPDPLADYFRETPGG